MRAMGWILMICGILQMIYAGSMSVELAAEAGIANNDLMAQRAMFFNGGGFAFVAGVIVMAAERIRAAVIYRPPSAE